MDTRRETLEREIDRYLDDFGGSHLTVAEVLDGLADVLTSWGEERLVTEMFQGPALDWAVRIDPVDPEAYAMAQEGLDDGRVTVKMVDGFEVKLCSEDGCPMAAGASGRCPEHE